MPKEKMAGVGRFCSCRSVPPSVLFLWFIQFVERVNLNFSHFLTSFPNKDIFILYNFFTNTKHKKRSATALSSMPQRFVLTDIFPEPTIRQKLLYGKIGTYRDGKVGVGFDISATSSYATFQSASTTFKRGDPR